MRHVSNFLLSMFKPDLLVAELLPISGWLLSASGETRCSSPSFSSQQSLPSDEARATWICCLLPGLQFVSIPTHVCFSLLGGALLQ